MKFNDYKLSSESEMASIQKDFSDVVKQEISDLKKSAFPILCFLGICGKIGGNQN